MDLSSLEPLDGSRLLDPLEAARYVLGAVIRRRLPDGRLLAARIVEVESYFEADPASHTYRGPSSRNAAMFGEPGHAYIYLSYGIHWCLNVTAGPSGTGAGVLVRAVEPLEGVEVMRELRAMPVEREPLLTNGPGKLTQALGIDQSLYGHDLRLEPLQVLGGGRVAAQAVEVTPRIGISVATEAPLRFCVADSVFLSRRVGKRG